MSEGRERNGIGEREFCMLRFDGEGMKSEKMDGMNGRVIGHDLRSAEMIGWGG